MPISPDIHILTGAELSAIKLASFHRGVERGIEMGCGLFVGREWFERASTFARERNANRNTPAGAGQAEG